MLPSPEPPTSPAPEFRPLDLEVRHAGDRPHLTLGSVQLVPECWLHETANQGDLKAADDLVQGLNGIRAYTSVRVPLGIAAIPP